MTESKLYKYLKRNLREAHFTRIENAIGSGAFDVHVTMNEVSLWWELKVMRGQTIEVRPSQIVWAHRELKCGKDHYFVWGNEDGSISFILYSTLRNLEPISRSASGIKFQVKNKEDIRLQIEDVHTLFNLV